MRKVDQQIPNDGQILHEGRVTIRRYRHGYEVIHGRSTTYHATQYAAVRHAAEMVVRDSPEATTLLKSARIIADAMREIAAGLGMPVAGVGSGQNATAGGNRGIIPSVAETPQKRRNRK